MVGKVVVFANLKPRKLAGLESAGMLMAASNEETLELIRPPEDAVVGERIGLENMEE